MLILFRDVLAPVRLRRTQDCLETATPLYSLALASGSGLYLDVKCEESCALDLIVKVQAAQANNVQPLQLERGPFGETAECTNINVVSSWMEATNILYVSYVRRTPNPISKPAKSEMLYRSTTCSLQSTLPGTSTLP